MMNYSKIFFYSGGIFLGGVLLRSIFFIEPLFVYGAILLSYFLFLLIFKNKYFLILGIFLLSFFGGVLRYQVSLPISTDDKIFYYNEREVEFIGIVNQEPDQRQDKIKLEIKAEKIFLNNDWQKVSGKVLLTADLFPQFDYGDSLKIICFLQKPEEFNGFAYDKYLARYNIYSLCYYPKIELLEHDKGNAFLSAIFDLKNYFISKNNHILAEPQASFLAGLLIGAKKSIPQDLLAVFNKTGTTHIIAVSGYNVSIIAAFLILWAQTIGISRKKAFWLIVGILVVFDIITGLQASIIRASIMGVLVLLASYLGRLSKINNVLVLTAVIMILINPKILVYDLGFQLSFLATLGLIYLNPILLNIFGIKNLKIKIIRVVIGDYFLTTLSAIILTTPLILYNFGKISLIAPLANILVLPFIPIAMLLGFVSLIGSLIFIKLGWVLGWSVWLVLMYIIWILEKLAQVNWSYFEFNKINLILMLGLYFLLGIFIYKFKRYIKV